jgi:hypothetical protein
LANICHFPRFELATLPWQVSVLSFNGCKRIRVYWPTKYVLMWTQLDIEHFETFWVQMMEWPLHWLKIR